MTEDPDNVVILDMKTTLDLPLERILDGATRNELSDCLVLGYSQGEFYMACQTADRGKMLILLERARASIMASFRS